MEIIYRNSKQVFTVQSLVVGKYRNLATKRTALKVNITDTMGRRNELLYSYCIFTLKSYYHIKDITNCIMHLLCDPQDLVLYRGIQFVMRCNKGFSTECLRLKGS